MKNINNYLQNIVIPFFIAQASKNTQFILYDTQHKVLCAANNTLKRLNFKTQQEIIGKRMEDFNHAKTEFIKKMHSIFDQAMHDNRILNVLSIGGQLKPKHKNYHELIFQTLEPILDQNGEVIALLAKRYNHHEINLFNLVTHESITKIIDTQNNFVDSDPIESMSKREFEITYLLGNGLSQYQIASMLGISRSSVLKYISDRIVPKLNLATNDSQEIIKLAILLKIHSKIPKPLIPEQIILLNEKK